MTTFWRVWRLPLVVLQLEPLKGLAVKTCQRRHIAYPATDFSLSSCQQSTAFFSTGSLLSTLWQVLMSVERLSGHLRALFTVYGLANTHTSKHSDDTQWGVSCGCTFELPCLRDTDYLERYFIVKSKLPGLKTVQIAEIYEQLVWRFLFSCLSFWLR